MLPSYGSDSKDLWSISMLNTYTCALLDKQIRSYLFSLQGVLKNDSAHYAGTPWLLFAMETFLLL